MTPTQRTLARLYQDGWKAGVVERFIPVGAHGIRKDFMGFADIIAFKLETTLAIQSCGQSYAEHVRKLTEDPLVVQNVIDWVTGGGLRGLQIWSWVKRKPRGERAKWARRVGVVFHQNGELVCVEVRL